MLDLSYILIKLQNNGNVLASLKHPSDLFKDTIPNTKANMLKFEFKNKFISV